MKRAPAAEFVTAQKIDIDRDRWGRPLVVPPTGGDPVAYTRCTTYVGGIEDTWNLSRWTQRLVLQGAARREDIRAAVLDTPTEDKKRLDELCEEAKEAGGGNDAARVGTYMHAVTEAADLGEDPTAVPFPLLAIPRDPADYVGDLHAYMEVTEPLTFVAAEQFTVLDLLKVGGTPDRVIEYKGKRYIADLKTGSIEWGTLKIAAQLAVYARSRPYDIATGRRTEPHGAEQDRGLIIHLPAGQGICTLYWIDLRAGWEAVKVCRDIRSARTQKFRDLTSRFDITAPIESVPVDPDESLTPGPIDLPEPRDLAKRIGMCNDEQALLTLWRNNADAWDDNLTALAVARKATFA